MQSDKELYQILLNLKAISTARRSWNFPVRARTNRDMRFIELFLRGEKRRVYSLNDELRDPSHPLLVQL